jgi:hypothetical protein
MQKYAISNSYTEHPEKYVRVITTRNMTVVDEGKTYLIPQFKQMASFYSTELLFSSHLRPKVFGLYVRHKVIWVIAFIEAILKKDFRRINRSVLVYFLS